MTGLRHLLAVLLLPFMVTVVVPFWLLSSSLPADAPVSLRLVGAGVFSAGFLPYSRGA
jgi:hypothetical protein